MAGPAIRGSEYVGGDDGDLARHGAAGWRTQNVDEGADVLEEVCAPPQAHCSEDVGVGYPSPVRQDRPTRSDVRHVINHVAERGENRRRLGRHDLMRSKSSALVVGHCEELP